MVHVGAGDGILSYMPKEPFNFNNFVENINNFLLLFFSQQTSSYKAGRERDKEEILTFVLVKWVFDTCISTNLIPKSLPRTQTESGNCETL